MTIARIRTAALCLNGTVAWREVRLLVQGIRGILQQ